MPSRYLKKWLLCILCENNKLHKASVVTDRGFKDGNLQKCDKEASLETCIREEKSI